MFYRSAWPKVGFMKTLEFNSLRFGTSFGVAAHCAEFRSLAAIISIKGHLFGPFQ